ncbi:S41 family peptidase [Phenylobacterium sp.]|jgi:Tol biopolymer transport system component|uniref:S41 family peptidase n=1 Tax=Phenylobacterium sp. TaxID=1871053 RepID=UPI002E3135E5|nr:S41 family peptidase [Phenylobacterium sp.]HEX3366149.1 S41 family peptidase [Phenylobacterium sp.]
MTIWRMAMAAGVLAAALVAGGVQAQPPAPKPALATPALSPDGSEIAFASGGDIWTVPSTGGVARLLVTDPATEDRPIYSPDGKQLAFTSTRNGAANIYILTLATGQIRRLTWSDSAEQLDAWSRDGKWIYFSSNANDVRRTTDVFRVAATGGTPLEVSRERFLSEFNAAPSPDGQTLAVMAKGNSGVQWWRNGHAHIDEAELWLKPVAAGARYRRLLGPDAKHLWPMWSPDGKTVFYMSDQSGSENLWRLPAAGGAPIQITHFTSGRVLFPAIALDGSAIVFERDFGLWKLDLKSGQASPLSVTLRGAPASAGDRHLRETEFQQMALSPDGKKVAIVSHGEVFAAPAKDGGPAQRITDAGGIQSDLYWAPDSRRLVYVAQRGLSSHLMAYDFAARRERALTKGEAYDGSPSWSPDGKSLAYVRGRKELHIIAFSEAGEPQKDAVIYTGQIAGFGGSALAWSPDSHWLAFAITDAKSFRNVHVIPVAGGEPRAVSFLANGDTASSIAWSKDGKYLLFPTSQRSEDTHIVRVDLLPHVPRYREDEFRELFKSPESPDRKAPPTTPASTPGARPAPATGPTPPTPPAPTAQDTETKPADEAAAGDKPATLGAKPKIEPVKIVFEGIRERATFLPLGMSADSPVISPDGKTLVFRSDVDTRHAIYKYDLDELAKEPPTPQQLASTRRAKRFIAFTPDSKRIYYLEGGFVTATPLDTPRQEYVNIAAEMDVAFDQEKLTTFDQAWSLLDRRFFDPKFHGQDWAALHDRFEPYIEGAHTPDEMRRITNLMIGELNASHSGINPANPTARRVADLGLRFDREAYEAGKGLVVREIINLGPASIEGSIKPGDVLVAVEGHAIGPSVDLDQLMLDRAEKRTVLTVRTGNATRQAVVRPVSSAVASGLLYRHWIGQQRAYVDRLSNGRLGYVHIADMSSDALDQLYLDLDAQNQGKEGVVVDVRNNNGGFVNGYVLDVFTRRNYLTMTGRGEAGVPSRQALGQRALGLPTVLLTNESSLSDAEDFTEGYRALKLGKVVGVPTAGWIIFTSDVPLVDGASVVRVPFSRIQGAAGDDMELHPRPVDVTVERPLGESLTGKDAQLEAAVAELLKGLGPKPAAH